ncbi:MAG TPA: MBOAT family O-acyltransferase [Mucilaginibacter sp.]
MLFNSLHFVAFFIIVCSVYFLLPHKHRWLWLLLSSCYFYMVFLPIYILILGSTIVVDYFAGILIEKNTGRKRKMYLVMSLVANIGVLAVFKYYNFLNQNISVLLNSVGYHNTIPNLSILLPVGLSFHTFQAMSYTIEVYRGNQKPERHFGIYALYVMFFPQLVAGPIERPQNVIHQFYEKHNFDYYRIVEGLKMMLIGYIKKLVIADRLSIYVNAVYNNPDKHSAVTIVVATIFFGFQIYCDFSAYSEIALGTAKILGIDLMVNFRRPYFAKSIQEFWSRWHISLSTWFRDYLYIPLGGNRVTVARWCLNIFIVFMVSGLWHGASWTFVIWGALHGVYSVCGILFKKTKLGVFSESNVFARIISNIFVFGLVCFAWIFFRANSIHDALLLCSRLFKLKSGELFIGLPSTFFYCILSIVVLLIFEYAQEYNLKPVLIFNSKKVAVRYVGYSLAIIVIVLFAVFNGGQFIYFQF